MDDARGGIPPDGSDDFELLTYAELGTRRGISRQSAERLARRKKWKRIVGNDGLSKVAVPRDWATLDPTDNPQDGRGRRADPVPPLRAAVEVLREQLKREADRADKAVQEAREARGEAMRTGLELAVLQERMKQMELAEAARRRLGVLRRIRAAIRGD